MHQRCYKIRHTRFENISIVFFSKLNIIFCYWCHRFKIPFCMRKHMSWCFFTKMIFSTLPRFIYKHETAGNPFMYLYKNYISCLCINPFIIGLAENPILQIYQSLHLHINNILYLGHGFSISKTCRNKIPLNKNGYKYFSKMIKSSWKLKYCKHSHNEFFAQINRDTRL